MAPEAKALARDQIAKAVADKGFGKRESDPGQCAGFPVVGRRRRHGWQGPARRYSDSQISSVDDLNAIADRLSDIGADFSIKVWAMIETRVRPRRGQLAAASKDSE